jgi:hypothetical protein
MLDLDLVVSVAHRRGFDPDPLGQRVELAGANEVLKLTAN